MLSPLLFSMVPFAGDYVITGSHTNFKGQQMKPQQIYVLEQSSAVLAAG